MKLLLISESLLEKAGADYFALDPWVRFPMLMSKHCSLTLVAPVTPPPLWGEGSWRINAQNLNIEALEPYSSYAGFCRLWFSKKRQWKKRLLDLSREHDAILLRLPSPLVSVVTAAARATGKPLVFFAAGDIESQSDKILSSAGLKKWMYRAAVRFWLDREIRASKHASLVYAYSPELARRHEGRAKAVKMIRTPHLSRNDFVKRDNTCQAKPIRLLRVSWLVPSKGIESLLEAVKILSRNGTGVRLEIVGKERASGYRASLEALAGSLGIRSLVTFTGWVPFDRMEEVFLRSDIQVVSSLAEGTPRILIEGAARGVPVVSTSVGGCALHLKDGENALLVPPRDPESMAAAIERLIFDAELRRRLITGGYAMARENSFENLGMEILQDLENLAGAPHAVIS